MPAEIFDTRRLQRLAPYLGVGLRYRPWLGRRFVLLLALGDWRLIREHACLMLPLLPAQYQHGIRIERHRDGLARLRLVGMNNYVPALQVHLRPLHVCDLAFA